MVTARVEVRLKHGVADPEGDNTLKALNLLGFEQVSAVRSIQTFEVDLKTEDEARAREDLEAMCRRLLANPVIHDYSFEVIPREALEAR
ncbi:MAG: phosphoribosylformylglycinamidine synthase subunit PurS [Candidatus Thermoplasmatota archaeon]|nr:phosphoribosylformylglycinamidine synthase subunit PurS [Candidatus Thermoplasmatota archaeon]